MSRLFAELSSTEFGDSEIGEVYKVPENAFKVRVTH